MPLSFSDFISTSSKPSSRKYAFFSNLRLSLLSFLSGTAACSVVLHPQRELMGTDGLLQTQTQRKCFYKRENIKGIANTLSGDVTSSYFSEKTVIPPCHMSTTCVHSWHENMYLHQCVCCTGVQGQFPVHESLIAVCSIMKKKSDIFLFLLQQIFMKLRGGEMGTVSKQPPAGCSGYTLCCMPAFTLMVKKACRCCSWGHHDSRRLALVFLHHSRDGCVCSWETYPPQGQGWWTWGSWHSFFSLHLSLVRKSSSEKLKNI